MNRGAAGLHLDEKLDRLVPWLVLACLALFPVGTLTEAPLAMLALIGLRVVYHRSKTGDWDQATCYFSLFFLGLWLPVLLSLPDSYRWTKTASLAVGYLRFFLAGLAVIRYCRLAENLRLVGRGSVLIVSFWIVDAMIQYLFGQDLFGFAALPQRLNGVFGQKYKLGSYLAAFSPFLILLLNRAKHGRLVLAALLNLLCMVVMLLAGSRGGWIMYGAVVFIFLIYRWYRNPKILALSLALLAAGALAVGSLLYHQSAPFALRVDTTLEVFKGDEQAVDLAISLRLPIWRTALAMVEAHPVNGVGARVFRYAYPEFAKPDDGYLGEDFRATGRKIGALHSHQMELEVLSETGLLGGLLFVVALAALIRYWTTRAPGARELMLPFALGLVAIFFPLNTHYALYSSSWSQVIYWFAPLYFAAGAAVPRSG